jgi:hypothetical protein
VHWELWVAPIAPGAPGETPQVLASDMRRLADKCEAITPIFSADGRWVFAALYDGECRIRLRRFELPAFPGRSCNGHAGAVRSGIPGHRDAPWSEPRPIIAESARTRVR